MQHINGLRDAHDLKREKRKRVTLYAADVRNMIELAFEICGDKYDIVSWVSPQPSGELSWSFHQAIQMCALLLCFMYTGASQARVVVEDIALAERLFALEGKSPRNAAHPRDL